MSNRRRRDHSPDLWRRVVSNRRKPDNRRQYHQLRLVPSSGDALAYALAYKCPDCDSEVSPIVTAGQVTHMQVNHDDTCPWLNARLR